MYAHIWYGHNESLNTPASLFPGYCHYFFSADFPRQNHLNSVEIKTRDSDWCGAARGGFKIARDRPYMTSAELVDFFWPRPHVYSENSHNVSYFVHIGTNASLPPHSGRLEWMVPYPISSIPSK